MDISKVIFSNEIYNDDIIIINEYKNILKNHKNKYRLYSISYNKKKIILDRKKTNHKNNNNEKQKKYNTGIDILYID